MKKSLIFLGLCLFVLVAISSCATKNDEKIIKYDMQNEANITDIREVRYLDNQNLIVLSINADDVSEGNKVNSTLHNMNIESLKIDKLFEGYIDINSISNMTVQQGKNGLYSVFTGCDIFYIGHP